MRLKLDLPKERWNFIKSKLEPHKNDSETISLFYCLMFLFVLYHY